MEGQKRTLSGLITVIYTIFNAFSYLKSKPSESNKVIGDYEFFLQFLKEYNVKRTIEAGSNKAAWNTFKSIANMDVGISLIDKLANEEFKYLYPLQKINTSVSSKLGMLLHPDMIIPLDRFNKDAVNYRSRAYQGFIEYVESFIKDKADPIKKLMQSIDKRALKIESIFDTKLEQIENIRYNRALDKLLLQIGREKEKIRLHKRQTEPQPY